jgi:hypothetical protein
LQGFLCSTIITLLFSKKIINIKQKQPYHLLCKSQFLTQKNTKHTINNMKKTIYYMLLIGFILAGTSSNIVFAYYQYSPYINSNYNTQQRYVTYSNGCYTYQYNTYTQATTIVGSSCGTTYTYPYTYTGQQYNQNTTISPYSQYYQTSYTYPAQTAYTYPATTNYTYSYNNGAWYPASGYTNTNYNQTNSVYNYSQSSCYYQNGYQICY